jgi:16S rRNA (cytidine1402-2'-O)-methyltransferase
VTGSPVVGGGILWLVATPIGNLGDLPPRAVEILAGAALICCEDTRRTGKLLQHAGIRAERLAVANEHTEYHRIDEMLAVLGDGRDVAVVSDAGTPGISDPGERLVRAALDAGHTVSAVPGPAADVLALTISGLATDRYVFEGFLPRSGKDRTRRLAALVDEPRTIVLYEAPHRIERTIADLADVLGDRRVAVCRELTKLYEEVVRGTLGTIDLGSPRGEYVVVIEGRPDDTAPVDDDILRAALRDELAAGSTKKDAIAEVATAFAVPKKRVYGLAIPL